MVWYASRWYVHCRNMRSVPMDHALAETLHDFLGRPGRSSGCYRKWCTWVELNAQIPTRYAVHLDQVDVEHLQPFSAPEFGCAYLDLEFVFHHWLENGSIDVDKRDRFGETLLGLTCRARSTSLCRLLLRNGAAVNPRPESHLSPLMIAAQHGYREIARLFIDHGADVNTGGHLTATLMKEKVLEDIQFMQLLLENGADPNTIRGEDVTEEQWRSMFEFRKA
ncbi:ankyrin repeat-containing domain protein [Coniochaeta sp. 2T2.1]|nr:ankyrin repeat-containing domain protein [Coniochaeta sp. 2T2.1]